MRPTELDSYIEIVEDALKDVTQASKDVHEKLEEALKELEEVKEFISDKNLEFAFNHWVLEKSKELEFA